MKRAQRGSEVFVCASKRGLDERQKVAGERGGGGGREEEGVPGGVRLEEDTGEGPREGQGVEER